MLKKFITGLRRQWHRRFGVIPLRNSLAPLNDWFSGPLGRLLINKERDFINDELRDLFGYHLLQLSVVDELDLTESSRILHKFALYPKVSTQSLVTGIADFNKLPLPANSIDVVILHHVLDYSQRPHQLLREASSVLISQGHVVIVGFNPWSFFGLWRWLARFFSRAPQWRHQSIRLGRTLDWLAVLDFEPVIVKQGFYCPPCHKPGLTKYLQWMDRWGKRLGVPGGGFYLVVARKDSLTLTPVKPQWQGYPGLRGWGVIKILGRTSRTGQANIHRGLKEISKNKEISI